MRLLLSETLMNALIRYLVLSETMVLVYTRNRQLFWTIRGSYIFRLLMLAYNMDFSIFSEGNGWTFSDSGSIHSSLAGWLWGVCFCDLHGYVYLIDGWYRCACVGAYCIRPTIVSSGNGWPFSDFRSIHSSLTEWLWGVCNTPLHGYAYWIDGWYRYVCVGAYCIRPSIVSNGNGWIFLDSWSIHSSLAGCLWGVCNTPLHGYTYWIDRWCRCAYVYAFFIRPSIVSCRNGWTFSDSGSIHSSLAGYLWGVCNTPLYGYAYLIDRWYRCAYVGAYCIRPPIVSNGNGWTFSDYGSIHSSLTGCLWGVCFCALHGYTYLIDGW